MPVSCQFIAKGTDKGIPLTDLDALLCKDFDEAPNEEYMCPWYDVLCHFGIGALMHSGGFELDEESFEAHWDRCALGSVLKARFRKYLIDDFTFKSWR